LAGNAFSNDHTSSAMVAATAAAAATNNGWVLKAHDTGPPLGQP